MAQNLHYKRVGRTVILKQKLLLYHYTTNDSDNSIVYYDYWRVTRWEKVGEYALSIVLSLAASAVVKVPIKVPVRIPGSVPVPA